MQSLEHISIIKGKPFVGAAVITARVRRSPNLETWEVESDKKHCTIKFKRRGAEETSITTKIEDIPQRYFQPSRNGEPSNWTLIPEDMLFGWTVRRVARRHFPDALLDLGDAAQDEPREVIDVAAVEHRVGIEESIVRCEKCDKPSFLRSSKTGGAYSQCDSCGHRQPPPQAVRDEIRGHKEVIDLPEPTVAPGQPDGQDVVLEEGESLPLGVAVPEEASSTEIVEPSDSDTDSASDTSDDVPEAPPGLHPDVRKAHEAQIVEALRDAMVNSKPLAAHEDLLIMFGWDRSVKASAWLKTLADDSLESLHKEIMSVPVG